MAKIKGYFLYRIYRVGDHVFVSPIHIYDSLNGAKKSCILNRYNDWDGVFVIVPIYSFFDRTSPIKYMRVNGNWSTNINEEYASAFYGWRNC